METIPEFYKDKNIFITGGTGFMGKVLVEKLLRSCPDLNQIYLLIRSKKGVSVEERWKKIEELVLFDKLKEIYPNALQKVHLIEGTIDEEDLSLSETNAKILSQIYTKIHQNSYDPFWIKSLTTTILKLCAVTQGTSQCVNPLNTPNLKYIGQFQYFSIPSGKKTKNILIENVDIVFHGAAAIQFTEDLVYSIKQNTQGTYNVAKFAKSMKNLKCFVYCSTAYSNCDKTDQIEEKIYQSNQDPNALMAALKTDPYTLAVLRDKVKGGHPSTYTFTKALAEDVMNEFSNYYPVVVTRPSLVLATAQEPFPGWADILNGLTSTFLSVTVGLIRVMQATPTSCLDYISVDHAIKVLIIAAWKSGTKNKTNGMDVLSCNYGAELNAPMGTFFENGDKMRNDYCSTKAIWYPFVLRISNPILYTIALFILQIIPSYIGDAALKLAGKRPMLVKISMKYVQAFHGPLKTFMFRQFLFPNENFKNLNQILCESDKKDFSIDYSGYSWYDLFDINAVSAASFFLKEVMSKETLEKRRTHNSRLYKIHVAVCTFFTALAVYSLYKIGMMLFT